MKLERISNWLGFMFALLLLGGYPVGGQQTAMYRANPRQTGFYDVTGPIAEPAVQWEYQLPGPAHPLVVGANVVLCPLVNPVDLPPPQHSEGHLYALDADTGAQTWIISGLSMPPSAPAVTDGQAFFSGGSALLSVNPVSGQIDDQLELDDDITTPCTAHGTTLYFGTDRGCVVQVGTDLQDPEQIQLTEHHPLGGSESGDIWAAPAVDGGNLYISSTGEYVHAVDLQDGTVQWQQPIDCMSMYLVPVNSRVCVTSQRVLYAHDLETLVCADRATGNTQWEFSVSHPFVTEFAVEGGLVYLSDAGGAVHALGLTDGTVQWQFAPPSQPGHLSVDREQVYFGTANGRVYALDKATGEENWHVKLDVEEGIPGPPVPVPSALFVASKKGKVFRLE